MTHAFENIRLHELAAIADSNRGYFEHFKTFLASKGYNSIYSFIVDNDAARTGAVILSFLRTPLPSNIILYNGIAMPYREADGKWLFLGWLFRDAPSQRLKPMLTFVPAGSLDEKKSLLLNQIRASLGPTFPDPLQWEWYCIREVMIDRLEGSRRSIKGNLFEAIVRRHLQSLFSQNRINATVSETQIRIDTETYDVQVIGSKGSILLPVKTRETMGGGHALLFTRDIHKSIDVASRAGYICLPVVIAESWGGNLSSLACDDFIYVNLNPNQVVSVEPILAQELYSRVKLFRSIE